MSSRGGGTIARLLKTVFETGTVGGFDDEQLLERIVQGRDERAETAFEAIVRRHGPMVFRVCRGILPRRARGARRLSGDVPGALPKSSIDPQARLAGKLAVRRRLPRFRDRSDADGETART